MPIREPAQPAQTRNIAALLGAACVAIAEVQYCWVATAARGGGANARVVKVFANEDDEAWWTRWFLTRRAARKTAEIVEAGRATLAFQHDSGSAYVSLSGPARLIEARSAVDSRLQQVDDPTGTLREQLVAVRVEADHIELHIRGITAEPWGHGRTLLERSREGAWCLNTDR